MRSVVRAPRSSRAFTLIEILVVIVIIGVIVSAMTLGAGVLGRDREVEDQSRRFWAIIQQAREEAELQSLDLGIFLARNAYAFLRFDPRRAMWVAVSDDPLFATRELPEGLGLRLWLESREIVLEPDLPERDEKEPDKWPPQVFVLSSGDISPFELRIERDNAEALWRIVGLPDNDLRVERRATDGSWGMVAQTKRVRDERERTADARR